MGVSLWLWNWLRVSPLQSHALWSNVEPLREIPEIMSIRQRKYDPMSILWIAPIMWCQDEFCWSFDNFCNYLQQIKKNSRIVRVAIRPILMSEMTIDSHVRRIGWHILRFLEFGSLGQFPDRYFFDYPHISRIYLSSQVLRRNFLRRKFLRRKVRSPWSTVG